jgi:hypothetical protein
MMELVDFNENLLTAKEAPKVKTTRRSRAPKAKVEGAKAQPETKVEEPKGEDNVENNE